MRLRTKLPRPLPRKSRKMTSQSGGTAGNGLFGTLGPEPKVSLQQSHKLGQTTYAKGCSSLTTRSELNGDSTSASTRIRVYGHEDRWIGNHEDSRITHRAELRPAVLDAFIARPGLLVSTLTHKTIPISASRFWRLVQDHCGWRCRGTMSTFRVEC